MKRPSFSFGDLRAAASASKNTTHTSGVASDDEALLQKQLAEARTEAQNALAEWRSYPTPYYEVAWIEAIAKVQQLEAKVSKRKAAFGG